MLDCRKIILRLFLVLASRGGDQLCEWFVKHLFELLIQRPTLYLVNNLIRVIFTFFISVNALTEYIPNCFSHNIYLMRCGILDDNSCPGVGRIHVWNHVWLSRLITSLRLILGNSWLARSQWRHVLVQVHEIIERCWKWLHS